MTIGATLNRGTRLCALVHLWFCTQSKIYQLQVMVFINQQVLLQREKSQDIQQLTFSRGFSRGSRLLGGCLYRLEVPVSVSLAVHVRHRRHDLPEEHPGLLL